MNLVEFFRDELGREMVRIGAGGVGGGQTSVWVGVATEAHKAEHWRPFAIFKAAEAEAKRLAEEAAADAEEAAAAALEPGAVTEIPEQNSDPSG